MSTARDYLAAVQQRADAATDGPWRASEHVDIYEPGFEVYRAPADGGEFGTDGWVAWADRTDAAFIAASRTDVPRLVAALTAVLDLADESRSENYPSPEEMRTRTPDYWRGANDALDSFADHLSAVITDALTPKEKDS